MAGTIPELTSLPSSDRTTNLLEVCDVNGNVSYKATPNFLLGITGAPIGTTDSQTLTNKTLTAPTISSPTLSGTLTGTYVIGGTPTFPASVATLTGTQTFTNKTLTSPTITSPTITNASITADAITGFTTANSGTIYGLAVTAGQISNTGLPNTIASSKLTNPYKFSVYRTAAYTTTVTTDTAFPFDTVTFDTGPNVDIVTNKGRFTAPIAGFYFFVGTIITGTSWTRLIPQLRVNGSNVLHGTDTGGTPFTGQVTGLLKLNATDFVEFYYFVDAAKAVTTGATGTQFHGFLVSAL